MSPIMGTRRPPHLEEHITAVGREFWKEGLHGLDRSALSAPTSSAKI